MTFQRLSRLLLLGQRSAALAFAPTPSSMPRDGWTPAGIKLSWSSHKGSMHQHYLNVGENRAIAYRQIPGMQQPTVVLIPGLHSYAHMQGDIAHCVKRYCDMNDYPFVMYDNECSGESKDLSDLNGVLFGHWVESATAVVEQLTEGPVVLVGASVGGWMALLVAQQLSERTHALLLFSPAINYVYSYYNRHLDQMPKALRSRLGSVGGGGGGGGGGSASSAANGGGGGRGGLAVESGDPLIRQAFAEDSRRYEIDLGKAVQIECPVRVIHGLGDDEVDPNQSLRLGRALATDDVDVVFRKNCQHQLESPTDLELFINTLDRLMKDYPVRH